MNIAEILKDYAPGIELYSITVGKVVLKNVDLTAAYPITVTKRHDDDSLGYYFFTAEGKINRLDIEGECVLFPSKENRDWSTAVLKIPSKLNLFKPFDKVLVRHNTGCMWRCDFFSNYEGDPRFDKVPYRCITGTYAHCIPYNEKTEKYLYTYDKPKQEELL